MCSWYVQKNSPWMVPEEIHSVINYDPVASEQYITKPCGQRHSFWKHTCTACTLFQTKMTSTLHLLSLFTSVLPMSPSHTCCCQMSNPWTRLFPNTRRVRHSNGRREMGDHWGQGQLNSVCNMVCYDVTVFTIDFSSKSLLLICASTRTMADSPCVCCYTTARVHWTFADTVTLSNVSMKAELCFINVRTRWLVLTFSGSNGGFRFVLG